MALGSAVVAGAIAQLTPWRQAGFFLTGFGATLTYALLLTLLVFVSFRILAGPGESRELGDCGIETRVEVEGHLVRRVLDRCATEQGKRAIGRY